MKTPNLYDCYNQIKEQLPFTPKVALVLGSGLGEFASKINIVKTLDYSSINGFPTSTVEGHAGRFVFGYINNVPLVVMQGRVHYYEGYSMQQVVLPIRLMRLFGAKILFLTNASGGINPTFSAGDLMLIKGQISTFVPSPLIGANDDNLGVRFPDMSNVYNLNLQNIIKNSAKKLNISLKEGVYVQASGPNYESPEEIKMFGILGADAVGMSTCCEALAGVHAGFSVCGVSCVTNLASGLSSAPISHAEVSASAQKSSVSFSALLLDAINQMENL
ncbi:MAG: purine-nucleoside phosphorylase [Clostridia bacterium]